MAWEVVAMDPAASLVAPDLPGGLCLQAGPGGVPEALHLKIFHSLFQHTLLEQARTL